MKYEHFKKFREICFCSYFREINYIRNLQTTCFKMIQIIVSIIPHCESRALSENSARSDVTLYVTMF